MALDQTALPNTSGLDGPLIKEGETWVCRISLHCRNRPAPACGVAQHPRVRARFVFWVSVLQSTFMQLLSACGVCERARVDAIFDVVPLDEALRRSLCWTIFHGQGSGLARLGLGLRVFVGLGRGLWSSTRPKVVQSLSSSESSCW